MDGYELLQEEARREHEADLRRLELLRPIDDDFMRSDPDDMNEAPLRRGPDT